MKELELPLFDLFRRLQKANFPIGIEEYKLVLRSLQAGFGLPDKEALRRLCSTLWVKSFDEELILNYHFAILL